MAEAPNNGQPWTDTDDAVVDVFPPAEAAEMLGRTLKAILSRRASRGIGLGYLRRGLKWRLRREHYQTGQGTRYELAPPLPQCRFCRRSARIQGLCMKC
jgi:hypothetical protein